MGHPVRPSLPLTALLLSVFPALATAQAPSGDGGNRLETVTVGGTRLERDLADLPGAATVVDTQQTQQGQPGLQLDESLARVPGLYLQNRYNFAQGLRLSSRGFGARAPFGVRGLRLNVDGFPETLPDGQSQVDAIDLDALESLTVLRGPASVLYGNASGGVVDMTTRSGADLAAAPTWCIRSASAWPAAATASARPACSWAARTAATIIT